MSTIATPLYGTLDSPLGELLLVGDGEALTGLHMLPEHRHPPGVGPGWRRDPASFAEAVRQLRAYFAGELTAFDLPVAPRGTVFQRAVWDALREIPYGSTIGYGELAAWLGRPAAARTVGAANGRNPIAIVIPCHRVIGASGALTGYGGGLDRKRRLLELERTQK
ncbi:MAG: methylated-DNA--[protein]-cysteine S-methyltransferase [Thermoleophilaceae bacterium]